MCFLLFFSIHIDVHKKPCNFFESWRNDIKSCSKCAQIHPLQTCNTMLSTILRSRRVIFKKTYNISINLEQCIKNSEKNVTPKDKNENGGAASPSERFSFESKHDLVLIEAPFNFQIIWPCRLREKLCFWKVRN